MRTGADWLEVLACVKSSNGQKRFKRRDVMKREAKAMRKALRDWFAGQALAGLMANQAYNDTHDNVLASYAYRVADAMLAEREKENGNV